MFKYFRQLIEQDGKLSSSRFWMTVGNLITVGILLHQQITQQVAVSWESLLVFNGILSGNYLFTKNKKIQSDSKPKDE